MNKNEIKVALQCCSGGAFETDCSDCSYNYMCRDLCKDALSLITEQEKEIEQLTRECNQQAETLAEEQEACAECELEQSWELFVRDKEIDRLRAESKRFENNMKSVLEIEKKAVAKEILQCLYDKCYEIQNLRECVAHITPLDILILAKEYGVEVEE